MVIASAALARAGTPKRNWTVLAGAFVPDASMFVFFAWSRLQGWSGDETWNVRYWMEPWQTLGAASNSFLVFGAALALALALWRSSPLIAVFCGAALLHIALDFPLHADDAHRHFWPLTGQDEVALGGVERIGHADELKPAAPVDGDLMLLAGSLRHAAQAAKYR